MEHVYFTRTLIKI